MTLKIAKLKKFMTEWLFSKKYSAAALTCLAAALAFYHLLSLDYSTAAFHQYSQNGDPGLLLRYGINATLVSRSMPFLSVLFALFGDLQTTLPFVLGPAMALLYGLSYELGRTKGGKATGALYLLSAVVVSLSGGVNPDLEQLFYTLLIVLYLNMETAWDARAGALKGFAAGLALGFTLLVRSPLFLFPPLAVLLRFSAAGQPFKRSLKKALPFILGAYALLIPWTRLNYFLFDKFLPFEYARAEENIITGVKGTVYTMEGDEMALAGLKDSDSVYKWAVAEIAGDPAGYILSIGRRVWHVLLMFPYSFALAFLVLIVGRKRPDRFLTALALYFILVHCLLSIEERYFYPLGYLLGFIIVSGLRAPAAPVKADVGRASRPVRLVFAAVLLFTSYVEYVIAAYPFKAGPDTIKDFTGAIGRNPDIPWLIRKKGEELLRFNLTEEGIALLRQAEAKTGGGDTPTAYILRTLTAAVPDEVPPGYRFDDNYALMVVKLFREVELNKQKDVEAAFNDLYALWDGQKNMLRGTPYERDRAVLKKIKDTNNTLEEVYLYGGLRYWPTANRVQLLTGLKKMVPASLKSEGPVFLSFPLLTPRDLAAFRAYVENTPLGAYLAPFYCDDISRKFLTASVRQARRPGKKDMETPLGSVYSALKEKAAKSGSGGSVESLIMAESRFSAAEAALLRGLYLRSGDLELSKALLAMRPESPGYFYLYVVAAADSGKPEDWIRAALQQAPEAFLSAAAFYAPRDTRKASLLLERALKASAIPVEELVKFGLLFQELGRNKEALALMDAAIAGKPQDARLYNGRGLLFRFMGDTERAEQDFIKALELDPELLEAELDLAAVYLAQGKTTVEAGNLYEFSFKPPAESALETVRKKTGLILIAAGYFSTAGRPQKAGALLNFVLENPALSLEQLRLASAAFQNMGRFEEALAVTARAMAAYPGEAELFTDRGVLLRFTGKPGPAEKEFLKALELKPEAWEPGLNLASLRAAAGRPDDARKLYERLLGRPGLPARARAFIVSELKEPRAAAQGSPRK